MYESYRNKLWTEYKALMMEKSAEEWSLKNIKIQGLRIHCILLENRVSACTF